MHPREEGICIQLRNANGSHVKLVPVRYEFPDPTEWWDANWLMIALEVRRKGRSWSCVDPMLTTFELRSLAEWFEALARGEQAARDQWFTEPNISFEHLGTERETVRIRLRFSHEAKPPGAVRQGRLALALTSEQLRQAAEEIRTDLIRFPVRGENRPSPPT